ncbi:MAG: energy-coupling factor ABC transporter ATP-binding protein [Synergistaceae bacterium]|jgi:cobalt/nickel transport system ATP-binding protein|nr:energy-coupling factor ABC transporter ATP-binding protein [Synergistaceae bacterium]
MKDENSFLLSSPLSPSPEPILEIKNLYYAYPSGPVALREVYFSLKRGEKLAVVGANGSGKSTLLAHLTGCFPLAEQSEVRFSGQVVGSDLERLRRAVGLVFQDPDDQLFMPRVLEDVAFGLVSQGLDVAEAQEQARAILEKLSAAHLADRLPHRLSGGEKRVIALAGILVTQPEILALDEPTSALDPRARRRVIEILKTLDQSMILATHDLNMALEICSRVLIMNGGRIAAEGPLPDLLKDEKLLSENGLE